MRKKLVTGIVFTVAAGAALMVGGSGQAEAAVAPRKIAYLTTDSGTILPVLDLTTNFIALRIPGFKTPGSVAVTPDGARAYVTNNAGTTVSVLNTATNTITATIPGFLRPQVVVIAPDGRHAYVTNWSTSTVMVIDTGSDTVTATIPVGSHPTGIAVSPNETSTRNEISAMKPPIMKISPWAKLIMPTMP